MFIGKGEIAWWLLATDALVENQAFILSTHLVSTAVCNCSSRASNTFFCSPQVPHTYMVQYVHSSKTFTHKIK